MSENEKKEQDKFPWLGCSIVAILAVGVGIWALCSVFEGLYIFIVEQKGWLWLLIGAAVILWAILGKNPTPQ